MVCLGLEPGAARWEAQMNPLSYEGTPRIFLCVFLSVSLSSAFIFLVQQPQHFVLAIFKWTFYSTFICLHDDDESKKQNGKKCLEAWLDEEKEKVTVRNRINSREQCDQIWRNFAILAKSSKSWTIFWGFIFYLWISWTNYGKFCMPLGKFSLI